MQPYKAGNKKLEELLESLFEDEGKSVPEDIEIWMPPIVTDGDPHYVFCCRFHYAEYSAQLTPEPELS